MHIYHGQRPRVIVADEVVVYPFGHEVHGQRSPDHYVVDDGPVRRVERHLHVHSSINIQLNACT